MENFTSPRIYVGTYAKYNNGSIEGAWLDLTDYNDANEFYEVCKELHGDESDPEFMFQDYEDIPKAFISESYLSDKFWDFMSIVPDDQKEVFILWMDNTGEDGDMKDLYDRFQEQYAGHFDDGIKGYADQLADDLGYYSTMESAGISSHYFDLDAFARDIEAGGEVWETDGHVFRNF